MKAEVRKIVGTVTVFGSLRTFEFDTVLGLKLNLGDEAVTLHGFAEADALRLLRAIDGLEDGVARSTPQPVVAPEPTPVERYAAGDKEGAAEASRAANVEDSKPPTPEPTGPRPKLTKSLFATHIEEARSGKETVDFLLSYGKDEGTIIKLIEQYKDNHKYFANCKDVAQRVRAILKQIAKVQAAS